jgi:PKD domain-containing protein
MRARWMRLLPALVAAAFACAACDRSGSSSKGNALNMVTGGTPSDRLMVWVDGAPDEGGAPLRVAFKPLVQGGSGALRYAWSFGDGSADSSDPEPVHTFAAAGTYRVALRVTTSSGDADGDAIHVVVR